MISSLYAGNHGGLHRIRIRKSLKEQIDSQTSNEKEAWLKDPHPPVRSLEPPSPQPQALWIQHIVTMEDVAHLAHAAIEERGPLRHLDLGIR